MESQRKKENAMIENLTALITDGFAGTPGCPTSIRIVRVPFAWLTGQLEDAGGLVDGADFYLGRDERARFSAFRYEKRRIEWLAGRIAAKCAALQLADNSGKTCWPADQWQQLQIGADGSGKPLLLPSAAWAATPPAITISHSNGVAVAMAARQQCGIDIQQITTAIERVEERFVGPGEKEILAPVTAAYGRKAALTLLWSAKEAVKKVAAGPVLPGFLQIILTALHRAGDGLLFAVKVTDRAGGQGRQQLVWLHLLDDFSFAVTTANQVGT